VLHITGDTTLSKRKTGALRRKHDTYTPNKHHHSDEQTFYMNDTKTIEFKNQRHQKSRRPIELIPQSINQEKYIIALNDPETDIVMVSGPAGTGKTYLAMLAAIRALRSGTCDKILLTRPAVTVDDEQHGFLPGDLNAKMEPWVRPLFDIIRDYYGQTEIEYMLKEQIIEITPLAFCRGRNFKNSWIILDEAQNATPSQIKMLLTRISKGSKIVINGDVEQTDRVTPKNGLLDLKNRIEKFNVPGMTACEFTTTDIRRHKIIEYVLKMYQ
jgi:phosphate starvation-inducible protein PhoH and related proteins